MVLHVYIDSTLTNVHDGDTQSFIATVQGPWSTVGFGVRVMVTTEVNLDRTRLAGLNCPELAIGGKVNPPGVAARDWVLDWYRTHVGPYTLVTKPRSATDDTDKREKYGRLLVSVTDPNGSSLNAELLAAHQAEPMTGLVLRVNPDELEMFGLELR